MPRRPRGLSEGDKAVWTSYARLVTPLAASSSALPASVTSASSLPTATAVAVEQPVRPHVADQVSKPRRVASPLTVGTQPGGLDSATWQRFRSGKLQASRKLDLHGMTTQRAYHALYAFIRSAYVDQVRCVEVVTGRGSGEAGGVIRREFPHWLNRPDIRSLILGAAHPHVLNTGAVRLILRRIR